MFSAARAARAVKKGGTHDRIFAVVRKIPKGRVTTYGTVARLAGFPNQPRLVGYALSALPPGTAVPWHRVINAQGKLSLEQKGSSSGITQRLRLENEGVTVDAAGRVALATFGWRLESTRRRRAPAPRARAV